MKQSKGSKKALLMTAAAAVAGGMATQAFAQTVGNYNFSSTNSVEIETGGPYTANSYVDINGAAEKYTNYNIIQFSTANASFGNSLATAVSPNFTVNLTDNGYSGETTSATTLNFFLVNDTTTDISDSSSPLKYEASGALGGGLAAPGATGGFPANDSIYYVGSYNWAGAGTGQVEPISLSLNNATSDSNGSQNISAAESYLLSQVQNSGSVRLIVTSTSTASNYVAYDGWASANPPQLGLNVTSLTPTPNNSTIFATNPPAGSTANSINNVNLGRVIEGYASFTSTVSVGNTSTTASALVISSPNNGLDGSSAPSSPIAPSGTGNVVIGFSSSDTNGYQAGLTATGNVTFTDANNTSSTIAANASVYIVDQRKITAGGTGSGTNPAAINADGTDKGILTGTTGSVPISLATTNTNTNLPLGNDEGPDVLTTETLQVGAQSAAYTVDDPFTKAPVATISATANSTFVFNSAAADPSTGVTAYVAVTTSGIYGDAHSTTINGTTENYNGQYTNFSDTAGMSNDGTTAGESDYADIYLQWQGYQPASVSSSLVTVAPNSTATATLTNAATNDNIATVNGISQNQGLRAGAVITGVSGFNQSWTTGGWNLVSGFAGGTTINGSQSAGDSNSYSTTGTVGFTQNAQMINGTYGAALTVNLENEQDLQGAKPNDLAPVLVNVQSTVTSNPAVQSGSYVLNGGTLSAPATDLTGTFTQTGGSAAFASVTGAGKFSLTGTGSTTIGGGSATFSTVKTTGTLSVTGGTASLAVSDAINYVNSLAISGNGTLDIGNNALFINYGSGADPIASIAALIASGFNGGSWTGTGITSALAAANAGSYGIGYADSADSGNPAGLSSGQIEIRYTLLGDANLDGKVNGTDFAILAANFNQSVNGWDKGDFNYDNKANGIDFTELAGNFNQGISNPSEVAALDAFAAANGISLTAVPEPASVGLLALSGLTLLSRRKRRDEKN